VLLFQPYEAKEFVYYANYGMKQMRAIRASTIVPAELLGWSDKVGTIEAGKRADIVAVSGNRLKDISELTRVRFVMKAGSVYKNEVRCFRRNTPDTRIWALTWRVGRGLIT
jgi:imidazolonepropionase-like amidohydrolase